MPVAGRLVYVGVKDAPNKFTLSYANQHLPTALHEELFWILIRRFLANGQPGGRQQKLRFKNKLISRLADSW